MKTRELMRRAGVKPDAKRDQHFLIDERVLDRIVEYALELSERLEIGKQGTEKTWDEGSGETRIRVLEIGGGVGNLTTRLVEEFEHVTVIEKDPRFAEFLRDEFSNTKSIEVIEGDALEIDFPEFDICISNLPYSVSSPVLFRLLPLKKPLILTFQREFAERAVAEPDQDDYGRLSVATNHYADPEILETIPRTAFEPQPEVESAVVEFVPKEPEYEVEDEEFFMDFIRGVFTQRRKTLKNGIRNTTHITGIENEKQVIDALDDYVLRKRPGKMSPTEFAEVTEKAREVSEFDEDG